MTNCYKCGVELTRNNRKILSEFICNSCDTGSPMTNSLDTRVYEKIARKTPPIYGRKWGDVQAIISPGETHEILLSDVLNYTEKEENVFTRDEYRDMLVQHLWNLSKPIYEDQSEECKEFICNLVK